MASESNASKEPLVAAWNVRKLNHIFDVVHEALVQNEQPWTLEEVCAEIQSRCRRRLPADMREVVVSLIYASIRTAGGAHRLNRALLYDVFKPWNIDTRAAPYQTDRGDVVAAFEALRRLHPSGDVALVTAVTRAQNCAQSFDWFVSESETRWALHALRKRGLAVYDKQTNQWSLAPSVTRRVRRW